MPISNPMKQWFCSLEGLVIEKFFARACKQGVSSVQVLSQEGDPPL